MRCDVVMRYAHGDGLAPREQERPAPVLLQAAHLARAPGVTPYITLAVFRDDGWAWGPRETYRPGRDAAVMELVWQYRLCAYPRCSYAQ